MAQAIAAAKVSSHPVEESTVQNEPALTLPPEDALEIENLVPEDDTPADNLFSEKQQRLLTGALYDSWPSYLQFASFFLRAVQPCFPIVPYDPVVVWYWFTSYLDSAVIVPIPARYANANVCVAHTGLGVV